MPPGSPRRRRFSLLGCAATGILALALSACGEGDGATAAPGATAPTQRIAAPAEPKAAGTSCPRQLSAFVKSLEALRRQLAVGLSYEQYAGEMRGVRAAYDEVPVDRLTIACLAQAATPGERALNRYIDAANAWGECLADASCTTASIEPVLQRQWRFASSFVSQAQRTP